MIGMRNWAVEGVGVSLLVLVGAACSDGQPSARAAASSVSAESRVRAVELLAAREA